MAVSEEGKCSPDYETSAFTESTESLDLSCIHWGYLNCVLVVDPNRKAKDLLWKTYWVDLCGSTLRFYRDLSLPPETAAGAPPPSILGPSTENEKKEAFLMLKSGATVEITGYEEYKTKKKAKRAEGIRARGNTFKLMISKTANCPVYYFQAPSKGSMYRWISKIEEGIDNANKPQSHTAVDKKLKEAKMIAIEQRRYHLAPELKYSEKDDEDSGMEGDVEESVEIEVETPKPPTINPRLEKLLLELREKKDQLNVLEGQEKAFLGDREHCGLSKACEFEATTKADYYLVPGHLSTLVPQATKIKIIGQLANRRWRCYVDLPRTPCEITSTATVSIPSEGTEGQPNREGVGQENGTTHDNDESTTHQNENSVTCAVDGMINERMLGSVPTSLLEELEELAPKKSELTVTTEGTPVGTPGITPDMSPYPSPPQSPYSPHRPRQSDQEDLEHTDYGLVDVGEKENFLRFVSGEKSTDRDAWEHFYLPSPPSSPVTSRSTSASESSDALDSQENSRHSMTSFDGVPVTYIGAESGDEPPEEEEKVQGPGNEISNEADGEHVATEAHGETSMETRPETEHLLPEVARRLEEEETEESEPAKGALDFDKNYSFLVTKKLRQRGISLIVGSSSSEDEDEEGADSLSKITRRKIDEEFERFAFKEDIGAGVRPYSAFVPRKRANISFGISAKTTNLRLATTDDLLRDYASPYEKPVIGRSQTCSTLSTLREFSTPENTPPINQRRTLQMTRDDKGGFGFTLQTYGIVQQNGEVEYMTFVLAVEEDGPAYMAGMRPGDIIITIDNHEVEEEDHSNLVSVIRSAPTSIRLVVVFVDAIKRMHLNTRIRILKTDLQCKEDEFEILSRREQEIYRGLGGDIPDDAFDSLSRNRTRQNSYLYTTELTSSFSKDTPDVRDSLIQYRQQANDRPRRTSLPDQSELTKHSLVCTTGSQLLENFSSTLDASKKSASLKLQKKVKKVRKTSSTFKTYLDVESNKSLDEFDAVSLSSSNSESSLRLSWPRSGNDTQAASNAGKSTSSPPLAGTPKAKKSSAAKSDSPSKFGSLRGLSPKLFKKSSSNNDLPIDPQNERSTKVEKKSGSPKKTNLKSSVPKEPQKGANVASNAEAGITQESTLSDDRGATGSVSATSVQIPEPIPQPDADRTITDTNNKPPQGTPPIESGRVRRLAKEPPQLRITRETPISKRSESLKELSTRGGVAKVVWPPRSDECDSSELASSTAQNASNDTESNDRQQSGASVVPKGKELNTGICKDTEDAIEEGKDRSGSLNISQLRRIFESSKESPSDTERANDDEDHDEIVITVDKAMQQRVEAGARPRLGSRPESFMMAMDSAEDWQLIPQDRSLRRKKTKEQHLLYESST